jgi:hypothetical protein
MGKQDLLRVGFVFPGPEAMIGLVNRSIFWWLNVILLAGMHRPLQTRDIYEIDAGLAASNVSRQLKESMNASKSPFLRHQVTSKTSLTA